MSISEPNPAGTRTIVGRWLLASATLREAETGTERDVDDRCERTMSVDSPQWPKWLRDARRRYVQKMAPLTGEDAAVLLHMGIGWLVLVYVVGFFVFLPAGVLAQLLALPLLWVPTALAAVAGIVAFARARRRMREGAAAAQLFLSSKYGFPFPQPPTNYSVPPWRHFIDRVLAEQTRGTQVF